MAQNVAIPWMIIDEAMQIEPTRARGREAVLRVPRRE
jgi:hypothetical protein